MKQFIDLVLHEFRRIFSNSVLMAIFFGAPLVYGLLFGHVYKQAKLVDLPIVIIDEDQSPITDKLIDAFHDNEALKVVDVRSTDVDLRSEMPTEQYVAIVSIPENFEADILQKRYPEIRVDLDMVNILNANTTSKNIQAVLMTLNAGIEIEGLQKSGMHPSVAKKSYESFKVNFNKLYNASGNYVTFMLPGLLAIIMQQIIFLAMALVFSRDFEDGYFDVLIGKSKWSIYHILVKLTPFILMVPFIWAAVSYFIPYFDIHADVFNKPMLVLTVLLTLACMGIGMLGSILIPSQLKATEILMVISSPAFVLSGFTWPSIGMPDILATLGSFIPASSYLKGLRKIGFYGGDMSSIQPEITLLTIITIVSFVLMIVSLQIKIWHRRKKLNLTEL